MRHRLEEFVGRSRSAPEPLQAFCAMLRELRLAAGQPTLAALRAAMPCRPGVTTLSDILNAKIVTTPDWQLVEEFVTACGASASQGLPLTAVDLAVWRRRHAEVGRTVEAIARHTRGQGNGSPPTALARTLPHDLREFTGREHEVEWIRANVRSALDGAAVGIILLDGMPGVGKTALAVHVAHRIAGLFPHGHLFLELRAHTPGQSPMPSGDALGVLLRASGVDLSAAPSSVDERAALWRDRLAGRKVLIVLDDAVDHDQIKPLLPGVHGCCVLVTSRRRITALAGATGISLSTPALVDAVELFVRLVPSASSQPGDVTKLVRLVGRLPLAIRLLAGRLRNRPTWSVRDLLHELTGSLDKSDAIHADDVNVAAAFFLSYKALPGHAQRLFIRIALYPGTDFDRVAAQILGADLPEDVRRSLDVLYDNHFVEEFVYGRYQVHDLIRDFGRQLARRDEPDAVNALLDRLFDHYITKVTEADGFIRGQKQGGSTQPMTWLRTELANMCACAEAATALQGSAVVRLSRALRLFVRRQGYWTQAETLHRAAVAVARQTGDRAAEALSLYDLGGMFRLSGDYAAAEASYRIALAIFEDMGDTDNVVAVLGGLGSLYIRISDYARAESVLREALDLYGNAEDTDESVIALHELGVVHLLRGDYPSALELQERALVAYRKFGDKVREAGILVQLGRVQWRMNDHGAAEQSLNTALEYYQQADNPAGQASVFDLLGLVCVSTGRHDAAVGHHTSALSIFKKIRNRSRQAESLNNLGMATRPRSPVTAMEHHREAAQLTGDMSDQLEQARAWEGLGYCHVDRCETVEGKRCLEQALKIYQRIGVPPDADRVVAAISQLET